MWFVKVKIRRWLHSTHREEEIEIVESFNFKPEVEDVARRFSDYLLYDRQWKNVIEAVSMRPASYWEPMEGCSEEALKEAIGAPSTGRQKTSRVCS